jgi:hypothetical protein
MTDQLPRITLLFAVPFRTPKEFVEAVEKEPGYACVAEGLRVPDGGILEIDGRRQDGEFARIVSSSGGGHPPTEDEIRRMEAAPMLLSLTGPGGSIEGAKRMLAAGAMLMRRGASGVLVYNSGVGHGASNWQKLADEPDAGVHWAYVGTTRDEDGRFGDLRGPCLYTTGMHVVGQRDVVVPATGDEQADWFQINNACGYIEQSGRIPVDGDVLTAMLEGEGGEPPRLVPMFRVRCAPCRAFPPGSPMHNPYGLYVLELLDPEDPESMYYVPSKRE